MEQASKLTFKALNERVDEMHQHPSVTIELSIREKYGSATVLLTVALFYFSMKVLPDDKLYTVVIASFFLLIEVIAAAVTFIPRWPPRLPSFRAERAEYAEQLDYDLEQYDGLIAWILQFPRDHIEDLANYAEMRQERFRERQPLLIGAVDKLGAFPILIAIATQFGSMHWPLEISWPLIIVYLVIAWLYWLCLISIGTRHRGKLLEVALKRALAIKDKPTPVATVAAEVFQGAASTTASATASKVS